MGNEVFGPAGRIQIFVEMEIALPIQDNAVFVLFHAADDVTVLAQKPKLKEYIGCMEENIARALNLDASRVNVKATTEEGLGFTGAMEGIACHAVCILDE